MNRFIWQGKEWWHTRKSSEKWPEFCSDWLCTGQPPQIK